MLKKVLEEESCNLIDWVFFIIIFMKANPIFQAICIGKRAHDDTCITSFKIDSAEIKCEDNVTLLGINIDFM